MGTAGMLARWITAARSIWVALLEVLTAEAAELQSDLARSGRELRGGLILVGLAAAVAFWSVGLAIWLAVELLTLKYPTWAAALIVFAVGVLAVGVLAWLARRRFRRIETPLDVIQRRGQSHVEWWQQTVLPGLGVEMPPEEGDSRAANDSE